MEITKNTEDLEYTYRKSIQALEDYLTASMQASSTTHKLAKEYFNWISQKTKLISTEKDFKIPPTALPNSFSQNAYNWLIPDKKHIFNQYYCFNTQTSQYSINTPKEDIPYNDLNILMHSLVLTRKTVIWVEFGVNIGCEFGGRHPALILKNLDDSLLVIPLSSKQPENDNYSVEIDYIHGFPLIKRWANVTRIREIHLSRVDFSGKIGNVNSKVMQKITDKMRYCGII